MRRNASILVGLLWCLALLSVVVIGVLHTARLDLLVVKNYGDRVQAHYLALAGIEKAKALLYQDARDRTRISKNHSGELHDAPQHFKDVTFGRGEFRVFHRGRADESGGMIYGVSDEESRLNVNTASPEELGKLIGMTPDVVAAIVDWRDADNEVTPGGAEAEYYTSLPRPYLPRNGPLQTTRELLMVRGVSRELLLGDGASQDGSTDLEEADGNNVFEGGWSDILTVYSTVSNVSAAGDKRVNIQSGDEAALTGIQGITPEIAKAIIAYRAQKQLQNVADLLDVTAPQNQNQPGARRNAANQNGQPPSGPKVISEELLLDIADGVTAQTGSDLDGVININTASLAVIKCLPGLTPELAQAIISYRQSSGYFANIAWLLRVPGMNQQIFKQIAPRLSARSETFRILSEGKVGSTGARQRIEVIVHVGLHDVETLSYREDL
jgi:general secretion pathway protein K